MRKPATTLHVPAPCAQPWSDMRPQAGGRHCAACQKVVIDFTQKTDAEILVVLAAATGSACGRFAASQLGRSLRPPAPNPRAAWWQTALAATATLLSFRTLLPPAALAQQPEHRRTAAEAAPLPPRPVAIEAPLLPKASITGVVVDAAGLGLPGVSVLLKGTPHGIATDESGHFTLVVEPTQQHLPLVFVYVGYVVVEQAQPVGRQPLRVLLTPDTSVLAGEVVIITTGRRMLPAAFSPSGIWQQLRRVPLRIRDTLAQ